MSEHVLSILIKAVGASQAARSIKSVDSSLAGIGRTARSGLGTAVGNIAKIGAIAAVGLGAAVETGIRDLATLEDATTAVTGAIKQMGETGKVSADQVAGWANQIESDIGAAFDDKDITRATATLIRFGSVTPKNLHKAMTVMTDLAAKTGGVDSAATLLAKALADPEKAAGKLARTGIVLTKVQQEQIKSLVKAGKTEQAQAMLLDLITTKTKGAAAATQGPYRRALSTLADVAEDARKALAVGFLPVIERVATVLKKKLADPNSLKQIQSFGEGLADAFSKVLGFAEKVPWDSVADALKVAGMGGKALLDAFTAMPPWVQTAVITGWGLNKLTGGAVTGIIGQIGSGLIKGVLGMNAGVVNLRAGVVNGAGGGIAGAAGAAGATSKIGKIASAVSKVFMVGAAVGVFAELKGILDEQTGRNAQQEAGLTNQTQGFIKVAGIDDMRSSLAGIEAYENSLNSKIDAESVAFAFNIDGVRDAVHAQEAALVNAISTAEGTAAASAVHTTERLEAIRGTEVQVRDKLEANRIAVQSAGTAAVIATQAVRDRAEATRLAVASSASRIATATAMAGVVAKAGGLAAAAAINAKRLSVQVKVNTNVITRLSAREAANVSTSTSRIYATPI